MQANMKLDVMVVGAHPDDIEIGCGGTVAALVDLGLQVGLVDLTDGEPTPLCPLPEVRLAEARAAAKVLGVAHRVTLNLPNRRLFDSFESRVMLATEFRRHRPRVVIGLAGGTPTASPDHWQTRQICDAAVFYSRLTKWDEHFSGSPPHKIERQYYYRLSFEAFGHLDSEGDGHSIIQDITSTLDRKLASIRCYQTQFPPEKEYLFRRVESLAFTTGQSAGFVAGERLMSANAIGTKNLLAEL